MATKEEQHRQESAIAMLAGRLEGASVRRSVVEEVIAAFGGAPWLRKAVETALEVALITVVEDVERPATADLDAGEEDPAANPDSENAPGRDPVDAGRARLERNRGLSPRRLAKALLTAEEEVGLVLLARPDGQALPAGGFAGLVGEAREAAEAMVLHNMGLVHQAAHRFGGQGMEHDDLVASGVMGLVRAVELFDPHRGLKFSTYATPWLRQSIGRAVDAESRVVRLPVHVCEAIRSVRAAEQRLIARGAPAHWAAIAEECGLPLAKVEDLLRLSPSTASLDAPVGHNGITLGDLLDRPVSSRAPDTVRGLDGDDLADLLNLLAERERDVLCRRHGLAPHDERATLEDIGTVYGVTRERIRQIELKALTKVRLILGIDEAGPRKADPRAAEAVQPA